MPHRYDVHLTGGPEGYAQSSAPGIPRLNMAPPTSFGGPGDAWSPEHLLLASVQACFLFTLRAVARHAQLPFVTLDIDTTGTLDRKDGVTRFTEIVLDVHLTVASGSDRARAAQILEKTGKSCLVSASLSTPVRVESTIVEQPTEEAA